MEARMPSEATNDDATIKRKSVTGEGKSGEEKLDSVFEKGQETKVKEESYSKRIVLENGNHDIEVKAVDKAGNETTESITVDVKYDAPKVENLTPTEDVYLQTGKSVKFEFDSEPGRSEEHTSELQSRGHLVCRLLLEKKKKHKLQ